MPRPRHFIMRLLMPALFTILPSTALAQFYQIEITEADIDAVQFDRVAYNVTGIEVCSEVSTIGDHLHTYVNRSHLLRTVVIPALTANLDRLMGQRDQDEILRTMSPDIDRDAYNDYVEVMSLGIIGLQSHITGLEATYALLDGHIKGMDWSDPTTPLPSQDIEAAQIRCSQYHQDNLNSMLFGMAMVSKVSDQVAQARALVGFYESPYPTHEWTAELVGSNPEVFGSNAEHMQLEVRMRDQLDAELEAAISAEPQYRSTQPPWGTVDVHKKRSSESRR